MIYPTLGVSMLAHMAIVGAGKVNGFTGFTKKFSIRPGNKNKISAINKIFLSLLIAVIIEFVMLLVIGSSMLAIYVGATSKNSNINIIRRMYAPQVLNCIPYKSCDIKISLH